MWINVCACVCVCVCVCVHMCVRFRALNYTHTRARQDGGSLRNVLAVMLDCGLEVSDWSYYVYFQTYTLRKCLDPLIFPAMG